MTVEWKCVITDSPEQDKWNSEGTSQCRAQMPHGLIDYPTVSRAANDQARPSTLWKASLYRISSGKWNQKVPFNSNATWLGDSALRMNHVVAFNTDHSQVSTSYDTTSTFQMCCNHYHSRQHANWMVHGSFRVGREQWNSLKRLWTSVNSLKQSRRSKRRGRGRISCVSTPEDEILNSLETDADVILLPTVHKLKEKDSTSNTTETPYIYHWLTLEWQHIRQTFFSILQHTQEP